MAHPRKHKLVLDVSFDRPLDAKRARYLMEAAINDRVFLLGRDLTRPGLPEAKMIKAEVKDFNKVSAHYKKPTLWARVRRHFFKD